MLVKGVQCVSIDVHDGNNPVTLNDTYLMNDSQPKANISYLQFVLLCWLTETSVANKLSVKERLSSFSLYQNQPGSTKVIKKSINLQFVYLGTAREKDIWAIFRFVKHL